MRVFLHIFRLRRVKLFARISCVGVKYLCKSLVCMELSVLMSEICKMRLFGFFWIFLGYFGFFGCFQAHKFWEIEAGKISCKSLLCMELSVLRSKSLKK